MTNLCFFFGFCQEVKFLELVKLFLLKNISNISNKHFLTVVMSGLKVFVCVSKQNWKHYIILAVLAHLSNPENK